MIPTVSKGAPRKGDCRPRIVVVADDKCDLALLSAEIEGRYGGAYSVLVASTPGDALTSLESLRAVDQKVAVVLASQWIGEMNGSNLLSIARTLHPRAKRVLLISPADWGHEGTADAIRGAIASGCVDNYLSSPLKTADEVFHRAISGFLYEWTTSEAGSAYQVTVPDRPELGQPTPRNGSAGSTSPSSGLGPRAWPRCTARPEGLDDRDRARVDRWPGGIELDDPELPGVRPWHRRGRAGETGIRASVVVRHPVPDWPGG
jgi:hypothetical protein